MRPLHSPSHVCQCAWLRTIASCAPAQLGRLVRLPSWAECQRHRPRKSAAQAAAPPPGGRRPGGGTAACSRFFCLVMAAASPAAAPGSIGARTRLFLNAAGSGELDGPLHELGVLRISDRHLGSRAQREQAGTAERGAGAPARAFAAAGCSAVLMLQTSGKTIRNSGRLETGSGRHGCASNDCEAGREPWSHPRRRTQPLCDLQLDPLCS